MLIAGQRRGRAAGAFRRVSSQMAVRNRYCKLGQNFIPPPIHGLVHLWRGEKGAAKVEQQQIEALAWSAASGQTDRQAR